MYGLKTQFDDRHIPIKKPWRIVSWGFKFDLHKKCDRRHDHGKCEGRETRITQTYTRQIADIILKTICRNVSIRFKKSLSNGDDTCSSCMHDRRAIKKAAVSVTYNNDEVAADLMWLMMFHKSRCRINVDPDFSEHQTTGSQSCKTFAASHSLCATGRVIGNRIGRRRPGVRDLERAHSLRTTEQGIGNRIGTSPTGSTWTDRKVAMSNYSQIIVLRNMISTTSARSSSRWERMADKVPSQPCTRSMTRPSTASLTLRSTSGMRLGLVRSRRFSLLLG